jgi:hypothetical protein
VDGDPAGAVFVVADDLPGTAASSRSGPLIVAAAWRMNIGLSSAAAVATGS